MTLENLLLFAALAASAGLCDYRSLFGLRNIVIFYVFAIYNIAPRVHGDGETELSLWTFEFLAVLVCFIVGYGVGAEDVSTADGPAPVRFPLPQRRLRTLLRLMYVFIGLQLALLVASIASVGLVRFYAGAILVDMIQSYGQADAAGAFEQVLAFVVKMLGTALLAVLLQNHWLEQQAERRGYSDGRRPQRVLGVAVFWWVILPGLQFARAAVLFGALSYLAVRSHLSASRTRMRSLFLAVVAAAFFVYVGATRERALGFEARSSIGFFIAELTPWTVYSEIKGNMHLLDYQYGRTILMPLALRAIPRGIYPAKPQNSSGYVATVLHPEAFEAGFGIPPTYMGDLYLNFGIAGVLVGTLLIGFSAARVDGLTRWRGRADLGLFAVAFSFYPSLMRENLATTLFTVGVSLSVYKLMSLWAFPGERSVRFVRGTARNSSGMHGGGLLRVET